MPGDAGHLDVEQGGVERTASLQRLDGRCAVGADGDLVPHAGQLHLHQVAEVGLVVGEQDAESTGWRLLHDESSLPETESSWYCISRMALPARHSFLTERSTLTGPSDGREPGSVNRINGRSGPHPSQVRTCLANHLWVSQRTIVVPDRGETFHA